MLSRMLLSTGLAMMFATASPAMAGGCKGCEKVAKSGEGFCCGKGVAFGVELTSKKLYEALAGKEVDAAKADEQPCKGCRKALKNNGKCEHCRLVAGKVYPSPVSFALAKGTPISEELVAACPQRCDRCKSAFKENGRCEKCGVGFTGGRMFDNEDDYKAAAAAFQTLTKAAKTATKCLGCSIAMVTDGTCEHCKVSFKNGTVASTDG